MASTSTTSTLFLQRPVRERVGSDSAAVGDSAVSSTAPALLGELERLPRPWRGVFCARIGPRLPHSRRVSPRR